LTSLPVYALSFFKAPAGTISSIESLLINFFWGGVRILGKHLGYLGNIFVYVGRREYGGLGVRKLREYNLALLGKRCHYKK
jgi:hypothetical protein